MYNKTPCKKFGDFRIFVNSYVRVTDNRSQFDSQGASVLGHLIFRWR